MSAQDIAKEVVRIATTHGLAKDIIDLMEKKLSLLTDELSEAHLRIEKLESEKAQLAQQLHRAQPVGFVTKDGLLWKEGDTYPYCPECQSHPVMTPFGRGWSMRLWICPNQHQFPRRA